MRQVHIVFLGALPVLVGLALSLAAPRALRAQGAPATRAAPEAPLLGRVVKAGAPVAEATVTLHRVTASGSGPVAEAVTDAAGRFRFVPPPSDTTGFTVLFATVEYQTVRYFGDPLHASEPRSDYTVTVFDTTSTAQEPIRIARRDLVVLPQTDGSWEVNEVVRVHNPMEATLVSAGGMPVAEVRIPEGAEAFQAGEGDPSPGQVQRMGERVLLMMPLLPGDRELFFRYRLAAGPGEASLALGAPVDTLNLFVRQPSPALSVDGLASTELVVVDDERFLRFGATSLEPEANVRLAWKGSGPPVDPVHAALGASLILLTVGGWAAVRNRPGAPPRRES